MELLRRVLMQDQERDQDDNRSDNDNGNDFADTWEKREKKKAQVRLLRVVDAMSHSLGLHANLTVMLSRYE